jgi:spermidine synthase
MAMRRVETVRTDFQQVEVWRSAEQVEMRVAGALHAWWHARRFLTGLAWDNLVAACLLRPAGPPRTVLMLGLAGGTTLRALRQLLPDCRFTAVEIDRKIVAAARRHMSLDATGTKVVIADAYAWLRSCRRKYDVVIDDVYLAGSRDVYRPGEWEQAHLGRLCGLLAKGGVLAANLVTGTGHRAMQSRIRRLFEAGFPVVRSVTTPDSLNETWAGGEGVAGARALRAWVGCFGERRDRELWRRIRVRRIR